MSAPLTLRAVLRVYLLQRLKQETGGNKTAFAKRYGLPSPDVVNAANGKRGVSMGMLERMAHRASPPRPLSTVLQELAGIALRLEAHLEPDGTIASDAFKTVLSSILSATKPLPDHDIPPAP